MGGFGGMMGWERGGSRWKGVGSGRIRCWASGAAGRRQALSAFFFSPARSEEHGDGRGRATGAGGT